MPSPPNSSLAPLQMSGHFVHMNVGCDNHAISFFFSNGLMAGTLIIYHLPTMPKVWHQKMT